MDAVAAPAVGFHSPAPSLRRSSVAHWKDGRMMCLVPAACGGRSLLFFARKQKKRLGKARFKVLGEESFPTEGIQDFERQLQELFADVKARIEDGEVDTAVDLLQANYELVKDQIEDGSRGIEQAAVLVVVALGYTLIGRLKLVEDTLDLLDDIVGSLHDDVPLMDSVLLHMGAMFDAVHKSEDAFLAYERSLKILEGSFGKTSPFLIQVLMGMAKSLRSAGQTGKAKNIYQRVIHIVELNRGANSEELVLPLIALGNMLVDIDKVDEAESCFLRIIEIYTEAYGENDGRTGMAFCSLGRALCAKGNVDGAVNSYKKGLQIIKETDYMPPDDGIVEKMRVDLADLLHVVGREQEGRELLEECLLITEKLKGMKHPSSVFHLLNLAESHSRSKNFVEAERILRICLSIVKESHAPNDPALSVPMLRLAVVLYHVKQYEEAEDLSLEALRIREGAYGADSLPVGEALDCLVSIQVQMGKENMEVLAKLKRLLTIQERSLGHESEEVMETLKKIVFYLERMGKRDEKAAFQRRLTMLRSRRKQKAAV